MLIRIRLTTMGALQSRIRALQRSVSIFGFSKTAKQVLQRLLQGRTRGPSPPRMLLHPFDVEHGVDTSGLIDGVDLSAGHDHDRFNLAYYGIQPSVFRTACQLWEQTLPAVNRTLSDYAFIDVGAGKGRAVLLASELPFRDLAGIELNADLVSIASQNITIWRKSGRGNERMRVVQQDALEVTWPPVPILVYLFNPFGWRVLKQLVDALEASLAQNPRPIDLLYVNPEFGSVLDNHPGLQKLWSERIHTNESEQAADWFASTGEVCSAYRFRSGLDAF